MKQYFIPLIILVSGVLVAGVVVFNGNTNTSIIRVDSNPGLVKNTVTPEASDGLIAAARSQDGLVYGNPDATYSIVVFSDFECPFSAQVFPTLKQLVDESNGDIKWEYRHLPLSIHPNAIPAAAAAECVAKLKGVPAFWTYAEYLFAQQKNLSIETYLAGATNAGISEADFMTCMNDPAVHEQLKDDESIAVTLGGGGTPYNVMVYPNGTQRGVPGALSLAQFKALIAN